MSVHRSNDSDLSYADHDVHWIRHQLRWSQQGDAGPMEYYNDVDQFEVTARGLDPDELAELRGVKVLATAFENPEPGSAQDEPGGVIGYIDAGFNLSGGEVLRPLIEEAGFERPDGTLTEIDSDNSGTDDFERIVRETDEVGQIVAETAVMQMAHREAADGVGGGGVGTVVSSYYDLAGQFGTGPIVDAADDWSSSISAEVRNVVGNAALEVVYGLYYNVEKSESGRTRFGR